MRACQAPDDLAGPVVPGACTFCTKLFPGREARSMGRGPDLGASPSRLLDWPGSSREGGAHSKYLQQRESEELAMQV